MSSKNYYSNNVEKERNKNRTFHELKKLKEGDFLKPVGNTSFVQQVISQNGVRMQILFSNSFFYFKIAEFAKAIGYSSFNADGKLGAALDAKTANTKICYGYVNSKQTYLVNFFDVVCVCRRLIKLLNALKNRNAAEELKIQEVQFETQKLIEWFERDIVPQTIGKGISTSQEKFKDKKEILNALIEKITDKGVQNFLQSFTTVKDFDGKKLTLATRVEFVETMFRREDPFYQKSIKQAVAEVFDKSIQIEIVCDPDFFTKEKSESKNDVTPTEEMRKTEMAEIKIPETFAPFTVEDIKDIGERAEVVKNIFDVTKKDALRAVVELKSQEINRDLSALTDLLKTI